jgi:hypothetical protein
MTQDQTRVRKWLKALLLFGCSATTLAALNPDNPASAEFQADAKANRTRIEQQLKERGERGDLVWFSVTPMSDLMRLANTWPTDGRLNTPLRVILAQDEFEPTSFQLFSFKNRKDVTFVIPDLKSESGAVLKAEHLDLKVVKIWYQNGNRWHSYFQDPGLRLVPELLLNDENLIRVDTKKEGNYARIRTDKGDRFEWISAPSELISTKSSHSTAGFNPVQEGFEDAETIQPVVLDANQFKQFFLTVHATKDQQAGIYRGTIEVREGKNKVLEIPIFVRVLPFELPLPAVWQDLERAYIPSMIATFQINRLMDQTAHGLRLKEYYDLQKKMLINARNHSMFYPDLGRGAPGPFIPQRELDLLRELELPTRPLRVPNNIPFMGHGRRLTFDDLMRTKKAAEEISKYYTEHLGHDDLLISYGDEQGTTFFVASREMMPYFLQYGIKVGQHAHMAAMIKAGYVMGTIGKAGLPNETDTIRKYRTVDGMNVSWYAGQHTGPENPALTRRQEGLLGYLSGITMNDNYRFSLGAWNDRTGTLYRSFVIAYMARSGLIDTLQWEGYREAIDDIRYATKLQQLIRDALNSGDIQRILEARKAQQYLGLLDPVNADLNTVRIELIRYILTLMNLADK